MIASIKFIALNPMYRNTKLTTSNPGDTIKCAYVYIGYILRCNQFNFRKQHTQTYALNEWIRSSFACSLAVNCIAF